MAVKPTNTIKEWFRTAKKPTESQFWDWLDSFFHKAEKIAIGAIEGLQGILNNKADNSQLDGEIEARRQADNEMRQQLEAMRGAFIYRGKIDANTAAVTGDVLTNRLTEIMSRPPLLGDVLTDANTCDWYFDGQNWQEMGISNIDLDKYQLVAEKGQAGGYASLSADGKVPAAQLPPIVTPTYDEVLRKGHETDQSAIHNDANGQVLISPETVSVLARGQAYQQQADVGGKKVSVWKNEQGGYAITSIYPKGLEIVGEQGLHANFGLGAAAIETDTATKAAWRTFVGYDDLKGQIGNLKVISFAHNTDNYPDWIKIGYLPKKAQDNKSTVSILLSSPTNSIISAQNITYLIQASSANDAAPDVSVVAYPQITADTTVQVGYVDLADKVEVWVRRAILSHITTAVILNSEGFTVNQATVTAEPAGFTAVALSLMDLQRVTDAGTISTNRVRFAGYGLTSYGTNAGKDILSPLIIDGNNAVWAGMTPISYSSGNPNADGATGCGVGFDRSIRAEGADVGVYSFRLTNSINGLAYNTKLSDTAGNWSGWRHLWHDQNLPYETGNWAPSIQGYNTAGVAAYNNRYGYYTRIGSMITITMYISGTFTTAPVGQVIISGLPYIPSKLTSRTAASRVAAAYAIDTIYAQVSSAVEQPNILLRKTSGLNNPASAAIFGTDHSLTNFDMVMTLTYLVA